MTAAVSDVPSAGAGLQTMLGAQGGEGATFVQLFGIFLAVCAVMYVIVLAGLALSLRGRRSSALTLDDRTHHRSSPATAWALKAWTAAVVVGLFALAIAGFLTDRSNAAMGARPALTLTVTANQWWWDVDYQSADASRTLQTANEIHLPVGVPVQILLKSNDVIHSLWIPNLAGKQDLIPGRTNDMQLVPRQTGRFRAQCAEFCGIEHTLMALDVTVESRNDFARWYEAQLQPAAMSWSTQAAAGNRLFVRTECSACHAISGTDAFGQIGPNLTHFASRQSIAAGALPMSRANIRRWIDDPQAVKPGSRMPKTDRSGAEIEALTAYLETLR